MEDSDDCCPLVTVRVSVDDGSLVGDQRGGLLLRESKLFEKKLLFEQRDQRGYVVEAVCCFSCEEFEQRDDGVSAL